MIFKDLKLSGTSSNLTENLVFWEELDDKTGEKISGGATFSFSNQTGKTINVTLIGGETISTSIGIGPSKVDVSGNQIIVEFNNNSKVVKESLTFNQTGIFTLSDSTIEFSTSIG